MATLALSVAGQFVGGMVGGPIGATIGRALGALAGSAMDGMLFGEQRQAEAPIFDVRLGGSSEGAAIPRLYGWGRLSGNIIWARELLRHVTETAGAKGFAPPPEQQEEVLASFALGFCEGPVARLGRIWADGQLLDTRGLNLRFYHGDEEQLPDSLIEAVQGPGNAPAYRGLCYLVVENLPLSRFGNRIPQLSAELCRVVGELEPAIRAVTVIPGATEFGYDPVPRVRVIGAGEGASENSHLMAGVSNWTWSIDELVALCPNLKHVALVVSWFGDDLRAGTCSVRPRVEGAERTIEGTTWSVAGLGRGDVPLASSHGGGAAYGGTPSDASVLAAIADLKARGLSITLYPLMLMDVPAGNGLADPYGGAEQGAYPWRGRITCHPAPGRPGSPDGSAAAAAQVAAFVPGYRAMVRHYANLCVAAGGVDALLIGSEMRGLTQVRGAGNSFPFVAALVALAAEARAIVGPATKLTYAADWSEYSGYQPDGEKFFHLDPLWASPDIDAIGIDNYMPLGDWRDGENHADAEMAATGYELDYLGGNIAGGEGFDWFYADDADRRAQLRTPIGDGAHGEPWIWRYKDLRAFWSERHYDRPGGVRSSVPTAWLPGSKPIWLTEIGCGAVDKGANQPNIFGDDKSAEGGRPYFSSGLPDGLIQRQFLRAHHRYWADPANNPPGMVDPERLYCWTWDARPFPSFPALEEVWADGPNHSNGHWLTGRLGALASDELVSAIAADHDCVVRAAPATPLIGGMLISGPGTARQAIEPVLDITGQVLTARHGDIVALVQGRGEAVTFETAALAADEAPILSRRRSGAAELPGRLALGHLDRERDYLAANATALRPGNGPLISETLSMVLDGAAARRAAEKLLDRRVMAADRLELALPPGQVALEPGDRIALPDVAEGPFEITEIRDGTVRRITAMAVPRQDAVATGLDRPRGGLGVPPPQVMPVLVTAHLPALPDDPLRTRLLIGAYARPWPGLVQVAEASSGGVLAELARPLAMGETLSPLAAGPRAVWDRGNALEIELASGHLADVEELAALAGNNRIAVESDGGSWEVIGFAGAELLAPKRYRLTQLLRGLDGTDAGMGPISAGRRVMLLDGRAALLPVEAHRIGESRILRCHAGAGDVTGQEILVSPEAGPALPLAPVHLRAMRLGDGAIDLRWIRRSRADGDGWGMAEPILEHVPEAWQVRIFDGATAVRTIETDSVAASYGAAEQLADFGGPVGAFTFSIAQSSPVLGPGHAAWGAFHD
ncbi:glycoside hydrolase/phage tail family protein [Devosia sp. YIM 151766]|uniref:baseplate multidomain protein megatron n=1 Tax=Devosia sp. YIM 151766 TaxID=3017325 RepID=UPI00255C361C|nr:glycoside hydrolase/phage tail family protein [Devosia sp. YIM 151766]WIY53677.1 glycoside hydrolase/phage tail family protein [Devosia sp. YIM 151766]